MISREALRELEKQRQRQQELTDWIVSQRRKSPEAKV